MRKYKCINEMMIVEVVDGDGAIIDNEYNFIKKGCIRTRPFKIYVVVRF